MENGNEFKYLNIDTSNYKTRINPRFEKRKLYLPPDPKKIISFIPGTIIDIIVNVGDKVDKNQELMILDAMKMKNKLKSGTEGKIKSIHVTKGDKVSKGTLLIELE
jgi:biotin carboxyl carrier protein